MRRHGLLLPFSVWLILFILLPLGLVFYYGVTVDEPIPYETIENADGTVQYRLEDGTIVDEEPWETRMVFSLANFSRVFEPMYMKLLLRSLKVALYTTLICLFLGYPVALILT